VMKVHHLLKVVKEREIKMVLSILLIIREYILKMIRGRNINVQLLEHILNILICLEDLKE